MQLLIYGAEVFVVRGPYEDACALSREAVARWGWYNRNCALNPYLVEGKKTGGLELAEQLGWSMPDYVFVSVGDGCTIGGLWKAFADLEALGWLERTPRMVGVQSTGAMPLARAFAQGGDWKPEPAETLADSICAGDPGNGAKALRAARGSGGAIMAVTDEEILAAMGGLARDAGVFTEPAGAAAYAGLLRYAAGPGFKPGETAAVFATGNGLKDVDNAARAAGREAVEVDADFAALEKLRAGR